MKIDSILRPENAIDLAKKWHKIFCPALKQWVIKRPEKGYRWENIEYVAEGEKAFELYLLNKAHEYFVMPECFGNKGMEIYKTTKLPFSNLPIESTDCYIFPKNLAWSMAFTHEVGWFGPYFSKHPNYEILQKKNKQALRGIAKIKQIQNIQ